MIISVLTGSGLTVRRGSEPALNVLDEDSEPKRANKQASKSQGDLILKDQVCLECFLGFRESSLKLQYLKMLWCWAPSPSRLVDVGGEDLFSMVQSQPMS